MTGSGIGGTLGTAAGLAAAPVTGGSSLLLAGLGGAAGAGLGGAATGDKNPLKDALIGGVLGGITGGISGGVPGLSNIFGSSGAQGAGASTQEAIDSAALGNEYGPVLESGAGSPAAAQEAVDTAALGNNTGPVFETGAQGGAASNAIAPAGSSLLSKIQDNPLPYAASAAIAAPLLSQIINPGPKFDIQGNRNAVLAGDTGWNGSLPKYTLQNTASPYKGDWNTYAQMPQQPLYSGQFVPAKHGGLMTHDKVQHLAAGGQPMPMPIPPTQPSQPINPLAAAGPPSMSSKNPLDNIPVTPQTVKAAHHIGMAIGQHLRNTMRTPPGQVKGPGGGQDDVIPAKLSQDEFIIPADVVSGLGDGSSNEGAKKLKGLMHNVRAHKTKNGAGYPPKAKNPLSYLKGSA